MTRRARRTRGASLCFGEPICVGDTTIITVARVSTAVIAAGGGGGGRNGQGGGGAGSAHFVAEPIGFITVASDGATFTRIADRNTAPAHRSAVVLTPNLLYRLFGAAWRRLRHRPRVGGLARRNTVR